MMSDGETLALLLIQSNHSLDDIAEFGKDRLFIVSMASTIKQIGGGLDSGRAW